MAKRKRLLPEWLQTPMYMAIRGVIAAMAAGDVTSTIRLAQGLARTYAKFEPTRVRRTMDNLGVAFPEMPENIRHAYAIKSYEHLFTLGVEMAHTPRLITRDGWSSRIAMGNLEAAMRCLVQDRPCIMITGHCGNWELMGYAMALLGFPIHALYRPLDLKPMDRWVRQTRERRGLVLIDKFGAMETLPGLLEKNALIGFIADQNAGDRGLFVPFFNRLASTYKAIALTAIKYDTPIICGQARRVAAAHGVVSDPFQYQMDLVDVIHPEDWKSQPFPDFYISARYRRAIESMVRQAPEQNLWLHRYWKSRPPHEHNGKPLPKMMKEKLRSLPWMTEGDLAKIEEWSERDGRELAVKSGK